jgi:hypothetical protein
MMETLHKDCYLYVQIIIVKTIIRIVLFFLYQNAKPDRLMSI